MSTPAAVRLIEYVIKRFSYPILTEGAIVGIPLISLFVTAGGFRPMPGFDLWTRSMEIIGLFLRFAFLSAVC